MSARSILIIYAAISALLSAALLASLLYVPPCGRQVSHVNPLGNPPGMVDRLDMLDRPGAWRAGVFVNSTLDPATSNLTLDPPAAAGDYPRQGQWTSAEMPTDFPFTELIPSWNAAAPAGTAIRFFVAVRDARSHEWSPFLYFGGWGQAPPPSSPHVVSFSQGVVHVDTLVLDRRADAYKVRAQLISYAFDAAPMLRRIAISYSGVVADEAQRAALIEPIKIEGNWARTLDVPYRTQNETPKPLRSQTCSPTSVSMVLEYWGRKFPTVENAIAMYDGEHEQFGTWNRATARAGEVGLDAWITRFRTWDAVKAQIAQGRPVIASIQFKTSEFPAAALSHTNGHLIVIRGFTAGGDLIVNDPANASKGNGVVYPAADLAKAWFGHGGVGYVIVGPGREVAGTR
jgi:hypothetical protein